MNNAQQTRRAARLREFAIGAKVRLPDGPYGPVVKVEDAVEYGEPVLYVTVSTEYGPTTRWVRI